MGTAREPTPPSVQHPLGILDFTPKSRKGTSLSQNRSDTDGNRATNHNELKAWADDFRRHYAVSKLAVLDFLQKYVPSDVPYLVDQSSVPSAFHGVPLDKGELAMYDPLVYSLSQLIHSFPTSRKPTFANTATATFPALSDSDHATKPDITITHPTVNVPTSPSEWKWRFVASTIEVKVKASRDPFDDAGECKIGDAHDETIVQLAKNGRNLLLGNSSCFVFVLGVYGHSARIYRFDRSGVIVSKAFSYTASPQLLGDFLWRLVHPEKSSFGITGSDTTITRPTKEEAGRMLDVIGRHHLDLQIDVAEFMQDSLWIVASYSPPSDSDDSSLARGRTRCFAFGRALSQSTNLFSRATVVWRVVIEGHEEKLFALKDSWRELCRKPEVFFYERIRKYKRESAWVGLASFVGSLDLGEEQGEESSHRTCSATLRVGEHSDQHNRSHMRTLTYPVGQKLTTFTSTKQLVVALRAAIEGHRFAFTSGVLHRDISSGNVLFTDQLNCNGFLHDFDYSEVVLMPGDKVGDDLEQQISRRLKDMTGTYQFMAVDVLMHKMHERKHDLESIYWLLIWIALRHIDHNQGPSACSKLFDIEDRELAAAQKRAWLETSDLRINRNEPLTQLLKSLRILFRKQLADIDAASVEVTYDTLLSAIDYAVGLPDWPENDDCVAFSPYSGSKSAKDASRASSKKRKTESRAASTSSKKRRTSTSPSRLHP